LRTSKVFSEEINFYRTLRNELNEELSEDIKRKIAKKIPIYIPSKVFTLYPAKEPQRKKKNNIQVLAADSPKEKPAVTAKTFIDEHNHYLVRLLNFKDSSKIYVFSTTEKTLKNYKIKIQPSEQTFSQLDNSTPIEINSPIDAENIELQFN
jgi:hypothetical protein